MKRDSNPTKVRLMVLLALLGGLAPFLCAEIETPDAYSRLLGFEYGQSREAFWSIENQIRQANQDERRAIEGHLIDALKSPKATIAARQSICGLLILTASCQSVPALKDLLTDTQLGDSARAVLQGLPCAETDQAFRSAVALLQGAARLAMITAIGERRDADAVDTLGSLLSSLDPAVVNAALAALGRIGGPKAASTIGQAKLSAEFKDRRADALLECAESMISSQSAIAAAIYRDLIDDDNPAVQAAAFEGEIRTEPSQAMALAVKGLKHPRRQVRQAVVAALNQLKGSEPTRTMVRILPDLASDTQVAVVTALGLRADPLGLPAVTGLLQSPDLNVQLAAIEALARFGDRSCVDPLFAVVKAPAPAGKTATESLRLLKGGGVGEELARYVSSQDADLRVIALRTLTARRDPGARAAAFTVLQDAAENGRVEAWKSLGAVASPTDLDRVVGLLLELDEGREQQAAEQAIEAIAERVPQEADRLRPLLSRFSRGTSAERCSLLRTMGRIGGNGAFTVVKTALKDADPTVQDTAVRVLSDWGDESTGPELLSLAEKSKNPAHRILGLRGYVRLAVAPRREASDQVKMLEAAMKLANRADEKRLVLGALGGVQAPAALDLIEPHLADAALKGEAQSACLKVALAVRGQDQARAATALRKLVQSCDDPSIKQQAEEALQELAK